ncbi:hypothetical protein [Ammoniphilus sp. YIM 78166]|uniref:hypothetical protein n=1 Tax=Ammoniphilus sp. YIM 78166 TaxID=1644106 RepID=UPI001F0DDB09|nr:hypothetical protein [Ammoniphilus sp. YIM 78166]
MGADDFGAFAERIPSTYFRLGIGKEGIPPVDLHHPEFHDYPHWSQAFYVDCTGITSQ